MLCADPNVHTQCIRDNHIEVPIVEGEGCNLSGYMSVNRVSAGSPRTEALHRWLPVCLFCSLACDSSTTPHRHLSPASPSIPPSIFCFCSFHVLWASRRSNADVVLVRLDVAEVARACLAETWRVLPLTDPEPKIASRAVGNTDLVVCLRRAYPSCVTPYIGIISYRMMLSCSTEFSGARARSPRSCPRSAAPAAPCSLRFPVISTWLRVKG